MTQLELASLWDITPRARNTDPRTSHQAAASVDLKDRHQGVWDLFKAYGAMTHEELIARYQRNPNLPQQTVSGLRTRCSELVRLGYLEDSGLRRLTVAGRRSIVWRVALAGPPEQH